MMSFGKWFRLWVTSFFNLINYNRRKRKSDEQREKERLRRIEEKYSSSRYFRGEKRRRSRRKSSQVDNERFLVALFGFLAVTLSIVFLPFGLFDWGIKSAKARKGSAVKTSVKRKDTVRAKEVIKANEPIKTKETAKHDTPRKTNGTKKSDRTVSCKSAATVKKECAQGRSSSRLTCGAFTENARLFEPREAARPEIAKAADNDEIVPKSTPRHECDQFIRKRIKFESDGGVLSNLTVGSCLNAVYEPENPQDKNAVRLEYRGEKIGYVPKGDNPAFATALTVGKKIYGVITEVKQSEKGFEYELEAWFDYGN